MNSRVIKFCIEKEQALHDELYSALMEHSEYDGCYVMKYSEHPGNEG